MLQYVAACCSVFTTVGTVAHVDFFLWSIFIFNLPITHTTHTHTHTHKHIVTFSLSLSYTHTHFPGNYAGANNSWQQYASRALWTAQRSSRNISMHVPKNDLCMCEGNPPQLHSVVPFVTAVCIHTHIYTYVYTCLYMYTYINTHIVLCHVSVKVCLAVSVSVSLYVSVNVCLAVSVCVSMHVSVNVCLAVSVSGSMYVSVNISLDVSVSVSMYVCFYAFVRVESQHRCVCQNASRHKYKRVMSRVHESCFALEMVS